MGRKGGEEAHSKTKNTARKLCQTLKQITQGGHGIFIPGDVQNPNRFGLQSGLI